MNPREAEAVAAGGDREAELVRLRREIDALDLEILELLNRRARRALDIARCKGILGLAVLAPQREAQVLRGLARANRGPLPPESLAAIFQQVMAACRSLQAPLRVAYLGPELTFSHQVALSHFGPQCRLLARGSLDDVFEEVERGQAQLGVIPVENSTEGGVTAALDRFLASDLVVCGEVFLPIGHCLLSAGGDLAGVTSVHSHPQALAQCRDWLRRNLPGAKTVAASSTAAAAIAVRDRPKAAAIAGPLAAERLDLTILARDIQDNPHNLTRFFIVGHTPSPPSGRDKTSLAFTLPHRPGSLHRALGLFSRRGLNLTRIESRPTKDRPWEYAFFVDFIGHRQDPEVARALEELEAEVDSLKVLGSYPQGGTE